MSTAPGNRGSRLLPALLLGGTAYWVMEQSGPIITGSEINPVSAPTGFVFVTCCAVILTDAVRLAGDLLDWIKARTPRGNKGTARWARSLRELGDDYKRKGWGPYWGVFKGREIISEYSSNALTLGPCRDGQGCRAAADHGAHHPGIQDHHRLQG